MCFLPKETWYLKKPFFEVQHLPIEIQTPPTEGPMMRGEGGPSMVSFGGPDVCLVYSRNGVKFHVTGQTTTSLPKRKAHSPGLFLGNSLSPVWELWQFVERCFYLNILNFEFRSSPQIIVPILHIYLISLSRKLLMHHPATAQTRAQQVAPILCRR